MRRLALLAGVVAAPALVAIAACSSSDAGAPAKTTADGGEAGTNPSTGPSTSADGGAWPATVAVPLTNPCDLGYQTTIEVGGTPYDVLLDTGSTSLALAGKTCTDCVDAGVPSEYTPGPEAVDEHEETQASYAEGSSWTAEIVTDLAHVPGSVPSVPVRLAAIETETAFFGPRGAACPNGPVQGILGLGPATGLAPGTDSLVDKLVAIGMPDVYAFQLCIGKGQLWFGGFDRTVGSADPIYAPLVPVVYRRDGSGETHYAVTVSDIQLAGTTLGTPASFGPAVLDTGSTQMLLPADVYAAIVAQVPASPGYQSFLGTTNMFSPPTCVVFNGKTMADIDATLPHLTVKLDADAGAGDLDLPPTGSYLQQMQFQGKTVYCPGIASISSGASASVKIVIGDAALRSYVTIFDREELRAGFMPFTHDQACP